MLIISSNELIFKSIIKPNAGATFDSRNNSNGRLISANVPDPEGVYATADQNRKTEPSPY